jgi:hypothetical protein
MALIHPVPGQVNAQVKYVRAEFKTPGAHFTSQNGRPRNWLARENPWRMQPPPTWWLRRLWTRDRDLRILPGMKACVYRVARYTEKMERIRAVAHDSEVARLVRERCIPVTSLVPWVTWNDDFFVWLDEHDTYRWGGPMGAVDRLEALEQQAEAAEVARAADELDQRGVSGWAALQQRRGERVFLRG